jgi:mycothiol system anti-sigma-R factor
MTERENADTSSADITSDETAAVTNCREVLEDIWLFLDDEMDLARRKAVERHLDGCLSCLDETGEGLRLKALLKQKCGGDVAPPSLRSALEQALGSAGRAPAG